MPENKELTVKEQIENHLNSGDWSDIEVSVDHDLSNPTTSSISLKVMLKGTDSGIELTMSILRFFELHQMKKVD